MKKINEKCFLIALVFCCILCMFGCKPKKAIVTNLEINENSQLTMEGTSFDLSLIKLDVTYSNGEKEVVTVTNSMVKIGLDQISVFGTHDITITYEQIDINVRITLLEKVKLTKVELTDDAITSFNEGEVDLNQVLIKLTYSDQTTEVKSLSSDMIVSGLDNVNEVGTHNLTIKIGDVETTITIEVIEEIKIESVILSNSATTEFIEGEFDITKVLLEVSYSNNKKALIPLSSSMIKSGYIDQSSPAIYSIDVEYKGFSLSIEITIKESELKWYTFELTTVEYEDCYAITSYSGTKEFIEIPAMYKGLPVKVIGEQAFFENNYIVEVTIPNTVVEIKEAAFYRCSSLKAIIIPSSVTKVEPYALKGIKSLYLEADSVPEDWFDSQQTYAHTNVDLSTIKHTNDHLYEYYINQNNQLVLSNYYGNESKIVIPSTIDDRNVEIIGGACFKGCMSVEEMIMPNTVLEIEQYGLAGCENLTAITLSTNLQILDEYAIRGCTNLQHIDLPSTLKEIRANAFNMCSSLDEIVVPTGVTYIGDYAFSWCTSATRVVIPNTVVTVANGACYSCSKATIYIDFASVPSTWSTGWNPSNRPVKYQA